MEGVTILSERSVYTNCMDEASFWAGFIISALTIVILVIWARWYMEDPSILLLILLAPVIGTIFGAITGHINGTIEEHIEYKVTIDESVSMTEFYEKYEVIDQEGLIFTVKEK